MGRRMRAREWHSTAFVRRHVLDESFSCEPTIQTRLPRIGLKIYIAI